MVEQVMGEIMTGEATDAQKGSVPDSTFHEG